MILDIDPITAQGALNASWVLIGLVSIVVILMGAFYKQGRESVNELKSTNKMLVKWVQNHEERITENSTKIDHHKEMVELRLRNLDNDGEKVANIVISKLQAMYDEPRKFKKQ